MFFLVSDLGLTTVVRSASFSSKYLGSCSILTMDCLNTLLTAPIQSKSVPSRPRLKMPSTGEHKSCDLMMSCELM